nr:MAG TPA: hypothetical protein [Caudoviricetes sp.]
MHIGDICILHQLSCIVNPYMQYSLNVFELYVANMKK